MNKESRAATGELILGKTTSKKQLQKKNQKQGEKTNEITNVAEELKRLNELIVHQNKRITKQNIMLITLRSSHKNLRSSHENLCSSHANLRSSLANLQSLYNQEVPHLKSLYSQLILGNSFVKLLVTNGFLSAYNGAFPLEQAGFTIFNYCY